MFLFFGKVFFLLKSSFLFTGKSGHATQIPDAGTNGFGVRAHQHTQPRCAAAVAVRGTAGPGHSHGAFVGVGHPEWRAQGHQVHIFSIYLKKKLYLKKKTIFLDTQ